MIYIVVCQHTFLRRCGIAFVLCSYELRDVCYVKEQELIDYYRPIRFCFFLRFCSLRTARKKPSIRRETDIVPIVNDYTIVLD